MKKIIFGLIILLSINFNAVAEDASNTTEILMADFSSVKTIQSSFVQEKHLSFLETPVVSEGKLFYDKKSASIRWEYTTPFNNGFLLTNGKMFRLESGKKEVVKNKLSANIAEYLLEWLSFDVEALSKQYALTYFEGGVVLTPLQESAITKITVWIDSKNRRAISRVKLEEQGEDYTILSFKNTLIDTPIPTGVLD